MEYEESGAPGAPQLCPRRILITRGIAGPCAPVALPTIAQAAPARVDEADEIGSGTRLAARRDKLAEERLPKHGATQNCANGSFFLGQRHR